MRKKDSMKRKKLLVTGGLGFIGSNFIRNSIRRYDKIFNVDNLSYGSNPANLEGLGNQGTYTFVKGDIAKKEPAGRLAEDVDAIVNFAAESHVDRSIANPAPFVRSNVTGTYRLLEAARKNDVGAFLHISTDEVYGTAEAGKSYTETDALKPSNPYSATKASAEHLVQAYYRTYGLNCIITRCTNNFGPYQFPEKLIPKTIIRALKGLKVPLYGNGEQVRSWIHVFDHVEALNLALAKGKAGEVYNVTAWNEKTNAEVVGNVLSALGKGGELIEQVEDRPGHDVRYSVDASKIQKELGWRPKYQFPQAIRDTVDWYVANREWWEPLADARTLHAAPWKLKWK
jgi:dTDP-glucose 4,6-dehydratase